MIDNVTRPLSRLERVFLYSLLALVIVFGGMVEMRSAFLSRRMGDLGCYLRPAWAAWVGEDISPSGSHISRTTMGVVSRHGNRQAPASSTCIQ